MREFRKSQIGRRRIFDQIAGRKHVDGRDESKFANPDNDSRGDWMSRSMLGLATRDQRPNLHYDIIEPTTGRVLPRRTP
jgi:hypothetical protein